MANTLTKPVVTKIKLVKIGNSRGFRVPDFILKQANLEEATLEFKAGSLVITPIKRKPREGWEEKIKEIQNKLGKEELNIDYTETEFDENEWKW